MGPMSTPLIFRLMTRSIAAAHQAGRMIRDILSSGKLNVVTKDGDLNDLQTAADIASQSCIVDSIAKDFPDVKIVAEEGSVKSHMDIDLSLVTGMSLNPFASLECPDRLQRISPEQVVVWVDPLDGTSEFTQGLLEHVTVLIGVAVDGEPMAGLIHQPFWGHGNSEDDRIGRTVWAIRGCGMGEEFGWDAGPDKPLGIISKGPFCPTPPPVGKTIVLTSRARRSPLVEAAVRALTPDEIIYAGGCGNKVLMLLDGKAHFYVYGSAGCKKWDTCGPEVVLTQGGGILTDVFGDSYKYGADVDHVNRKGVLGAFDKFKHKWALDNIPQEVKDHLS